MRRWAYPIDVVFVIDVSPASSQWPPCVLCVFPSATDRIYCVTVPASDKVQEVRDELDRTRTQRANPSVPVSGLSNTRDLIYRAREHGTIGVGLLFNAAHAWASPNLAAMLQGRTTPFAPPLADVLLPAFQQLYANGESAAAHRGRFSVARAIVGDVTHADWKEREVVDEGTGAVSNKRSLMVRFKPSAWRGIPDSECPMCTVWLNGSWAFAGRAEQGCGITIPFAIMTAKHFDSFDSTGKWGLTFTVYFKWPKVVFGARQP